MATVRGKRTKLPPETSCRQREESSENVPSKPGREENEPQEGKTTSAEHKKDLGSQQQERRPAEDHGARVTALFRISYVHNRT